MVRREARLQKKRLKRRRQKNEWLTQRHVFVQAVRTLKKARRTNRGWWKRPSDWLIKTLRLDKKRKERPDEVEEFYRTEKEANEAEGKRLKIAKELEDQAKAKANRGVIRGMKSAAKKVAGGLKNMFRRHPK